jgi:ribonucleotide reductase beta subunit family protein with ferritin-like domain
MTTKVRQTRKPAYNSTYKKLAVQWLNEALYFVSSFVVVDSFVLRNRQLLVAANR